MRQLAAAVHSCHDTHRFLPAGTAPNLRTEPYPFLNWHARILPYLEQTRLWDSIKTAFAQDPSFLSVPPHIYRSTIVSVFVCPADSRAASIGHGPDGAEVAFTTYLGVVGTNSRENDGVLYYDSRVALIEVTDGLSNSLLIGERPPSPDERYAWWYAGVGQSLNGNADATLGVRDFRTSIHPNDRLCTGGPYHFGPGETTNQCDAFHFWSHHPGGAHFAFCDGSVRFLAYSSDPILPALATRGGGEVAQVQE
jgi:prepilin-type processing-associated H-X9-DG protein